MTRTRNDLIVSLYTCAEVLERGIKAYRVQHEANWVGYDVPDAEAMVDQNGRPILPGMYAELGHVLAAIVALGGME